MKRYIIKRILQVIPVIILASILSFAMIYMAPGDPAEFYRTPNMTDEDMEIVRENMGLNQPVPVQYVKWVKQILKGDWGYSIHNKRKVTTQILEKLPATLGIMGASILFSLAVAIPLGLIAGSKKNTLADKAISVFNYIGISIPEFWFAILMILFLSLKLKLLPGSGMHTTGENSFWDVVKHAIMPVLALSISKISIYVRYIRANVITQMEEDYVLTARAKGTPEKQILFHHVMKNCLLPIITVVGMNLGSLVAGSYIVETVFGWPGLGTFGITAIRTRDYPLIMGTTMLSCIVLITGNFLADICYHFADPRIKLEGGKAV